MHVGDAVVARVAAHRARRVPGVVALRADLTQALLGLADSVLHPDRDTGALPADGVHAQVHGGSVEVTITLATRLGHNCRDVAQSVQREVAAEVAAYTGLDAVVSVVVAEVLLD
ncbi:hypothetical protein GCM10017691_46280 [Pseudonocardia petroleophila]